MMTGALVLGLGVSIPALAQDDAPYVQSADAHRFAALFDAHDGALGAELLQSAYLDGAGRGVEVFTPNRIQTADNLARAVAQDPDAYRRGIEVCLPIADEMSADLREVYAAMQPLFPGYDLPEIHVVFGAGNSSGTAASDGLVLGLEVICRVGQSEAEIRDIFRFFFAHEAVHALQSQNMDAFGRDPLLYMSLLEGQADYVSLLVTGQTPTQSRHDWALENEDWLWPEFAQDRRILKAASSAGASYGDLPPEAAAALRRWHANAGQPPEGWPYELGYWMGRQIVADYVEGSDDPDQALMDLLDINDAVSILAATDYYDRAGGDAQ